MIKDYYRLKSFSLFLRTCHDKKGLTNKEREYKIHNRCIIK